MKSIVLVAVTLFAAQGCGDGLGTKLSVNGSSIECRGGSGHGKVASDSEPGRSCTQTFYDCSDDKTYTASCQSPENNGPVSCACLIDDVTAGPGFETPDCPLADEGLIAGCGWAP